MVKKRGLGRGLAALIPESEEIEKKTELTQSEAKKEKTPRQNKETKPAALKKEVTLEIRKEGKTTGEEKNSGLKTQMLSLDLISPNPDQPRKHFDEKTLKELSESIKKYGLLQPIVVLERKSAKKEDPPYQIIAGERRYRAAKEAGLEEIPVLVRKDSQKEGALLSVIENIQRENLNPLEEAQAYKEIMADHGLTQEGLAQVLGKSRAYIANISRLDSLDPLSKKALMEGKLSSSQARTLLSEPDLKKRGALRDLFITGQLNVNAAEKRTRRGSRNKTEKNIFIRDLEDRLSETLGTPVSIYSRKKGWDIQISCYSEEDLTQFSDKLLGGEGV